MTNLPTAYRIINTYIVAAALQCIFIVIQTNTYITTILKELLHMSDQT